MDSSCESELVEAGASVSEVVAEPEPCEVEEEVVEELLPCEPEPESEEDDIVLDPSSDCEVFESVGAGSVPQVAVA